MRVSQQGHDWPYTLTETGKDKRMGTDCLWVTDVACVHTLICQRVYSAASWRTAAFVKCHMTCDTAASLRCAAVPCDGWIAASSCHRVKNHSIPKLPRCHLPGSPAVPVRVPAASHAAGVVITRHCLSTACSRVSKAHCTVYLTGSLIKVTQAVGVHRCAAAGQDVTAVGCCGNRPGSCFDWWWPSGIWSY
jgi:hypothetical protein